MDDEDMPLFARGFVAKIVQMAAYTTAVLFMVIALLAMLAHVAIQLVGYVGLDGLAFGVAIAAMVAWGIGTAAGWYASRAGRKLETREFDDENWSDPE